MSDFLTTIRVPHVLAIGFTRDKTEGGISDSTEVAITLRLLGVSRGSVAVALDHSEVATLMLIATIWEPSLTLVKVAFARNLAPLSVAHAAPVLTIRLATLWNGFNLLLLKFLRLFFLNWLAVILDRAELSLLLWNDIAVDGVSNPLVEVNVVNVPLVILPVLHDDHLVSHEEVLAVFAHEFPVAWFLELPLPDLVL